MSKDDKQMSSIDDKLFKVKYKSGSKSHLCPRNDLCTSCTEKYCVFVCPANVYEWDEQEGKLVVGYENCLECGACRIACRNCAIDWKYPEGGYGVTFKYS